MSVHRSGRRSGAQPIRDALRGLRIELRILNDKVAEAAGLNPRDLDILDIIDREGPCTPSQVAERTGYRRATLTGILARLERERWISRDPDPADGRSVVLSSTDRFNELRTLYAPLDDKAAALADSLTVDQCAMIARALTAVAVSLREATPQVGRRDPRVTVPSASPISGHEDHRKGPIH